MQSVSHREVQELIMHLPEAKLYTAYKMMLNLINDKNDKYDKYDKYNKNDEHINQLEMIESNKLVRKALMEKQANLLYDYYQSSHEVRSDWQHGDFNDY